MLGLWITADAFEVKGWQVSYLGASAPTVNLLAEIDCWYPDLVGLSLIFADLCVAYKSGDRTLLAR